MKNIHLIPTDKPSRLIIYSTLLNEFRLLNEPYEDWKHKRHIYITNDEEIKEGDWILNETHNIEKAISHYNYKSLSSDCKKIILTTDQDLDGVQAIDDEFLEWFVKNPSCEEVEVALQHQYHSSKKFYIDADYVDCSKEQYESIKKEIPTCPVRRLYKTIIPKEEPKQETLEEEKDLNYWKNNAEEDYLKVPISVLRYISELENQQERMYSKEDMEYAFKSSSLTNVLDVYESFEEFIEQYKKK